MVAPAVALDLSLAPMDIITVVLQYFCDKDRFTCALVCKACSNAAAAATRKIKVWQPTVQTFNCLQQWLQNHGHHLVVLQLHECGGLALTALPCAQLQDLMLHGDCQDGSNINVSSRVWGDIAAATKLTSLALQALQTASQQADVVSALTALQDLEQLTWHDVQCSGERQLCDSLLLQHLTKLTALDIERVSAAAFIHVGSLTKLQYLSVSAAADWAAAGCPGLQELKALTRIKSGQRVEDIPASVSQLTALQELDVFTATPTALNRLQALTGLTHLHVRWLEGLSLAIPPLQLPGLQHLMLADWSNSGPMPMSFLASCTQLRVMTLWAIDLRGPGSLVASTMLQHLVLGGCGLSAADGVAGGPASWQQVFPGPGRLPHLTSLQLSCMRPDLQVVDIERVVACCSSLQALHLTTLQDSFVSALVQLSGLTRLKLHEAGDEQCGALAQLTGLQELTMDRPRKVSAAGLRQLAVLEQLTSLGFAWWPGKVSLVLREHMSDTLSDYPTAIVNQVCV